MQVEICRVGRTLRLDENTRIVIHRRARGRVCLGAMVLTGTLLTLDGAPTHRPPFAAGAHTPGFGIPMPSCPPSCRSVVPC